MSGGENELSNVIVAFRYLERSDMDRLFVWRNDPAVAGHMYNSKPFTRESHEAWFSKVIVEPTRKYWIIEANARPVGLCNIYDIDELNSRCSWAFYIGETDCRGLGIGSFTERYVLNYVFTELGLKKIWCEVLVTNTAVIRLHEKFGFKREALFRSHIRRGDEYLDVVGLGLLNSEWREFSRHD